MLKDEENKYKSQSQINLDQAMASLDQSSHKLDKFSEEQRMKNEELKRKMEERAKARAALKDSFNAEIKKSDDSYKETKQNIN